MVTKTIAKPAPVVTGRNKQARELAFMRIAPNAYAEGTSRESLVNVLREVLGKRPSGERDTWPKAHMALIDSCRDEYVIGGVAATITGDASAALELARDIVLHYAGATGTGKLRKDQKARRTTAQELAYGNVRKRWSLLLAEIGHGEAQTVKDKNNKAKKTRKTRGSQANAPKGALVSAPPTFESLANGKAGTVSAEDYSAHMLHALATLLAYDNKHADVRPSTHGAFAEKLVALHKLAISCGDAFLKRESAKLQNT